MRSEPNGIAWMIAARRPDRPMQRPRGLDRASGGLVRRLDPRRLMRPTPARCCAGA